jgi:glycosyltransferase involved in cell wall biosynthesis
MNSNNIKIAYITMNRIFPLSTTGPAIADYATIKGLRELGHDIEIFTRKNAVIYSNNVNNYLENIGITYIEYNKLITYFRFLKNFIKYLPKCSIVYFSSPPTGLVTLPLLFLSNFFRKKSVYYLMGSLLNVNKNSRSAKIFKYLFKFDFLDKILLSLHCEDEFEKLYGKKDKVSVVPHGIVVDLYRNTDDEKLDGEVNILFSGNLIKKKGILDLLYAFTKLSNEFKNVHLYITGSGNLKETIQNLILKKGIEEKVHLLGFVPYERLKSLYKSADIFVSPSLEELMSIALLEAMTFKCAIVCSDVSAQEVIEHGKNGLVFKAGDVEGLYSNLRDLLSNKNKIAMYRVAARATIINNFHYKIVARELDRILRECCHIR